MDNIDDEVLVAPSVEVLGEGPRFADGSATDSSTISSVAVAWPANANARRLT